MGTESTAKQAAENAVKTPGNDAAKETATEPEPIPQPRQPIPLSFSQQHCWASLNEQMAILVAEITAPHGLDPRRLGQEFAIDGKVIFFER